MLRLPDAAAIADDVRSGRRSAREVCDESLRRIDATNASIAAFLDVLTDSARAAATRIDEQRGRGERLGPLAGVPIAVKDLICTAAGRTTCGSRGLRDYRSPFSATAVERLEAAGALIIGKTNLDEFGMGSSNENSAFGPTRNPWDVSRVPGGSSGGSAAAVAAGCVPVALGTDTGGSVRQPASLCGVIGLKPTYGRISRYGLVAYGSSLDQIGTLTTSVRDAALLLGVMAGGDPRDATCLAVRVPDYSAGLSEAELADLAPKLRLGVPREYFGEGLDAEVAAAVRAAIERLRSAGARVIDVSLPHTPYCIATYYLLATAECSSNLARFDGVHYGHRAADAAQIADLLCRSRRESFGAEVRLRILLGTFALSAGYAEEYYRRAEDARRRIGADFARVFQEVDVLACPTAPTCAFGLGEKMADPLAMYLSDIYTIGASLAGVPAMSIPCGFSSRGLPIGLQLMAGPLREDLLLAAARLHERDWADSGVLAPPAAG
jgi:aspartyl-tRNA(Asn)/glutamyl-tRNA(Gln) amidotransferase subunit A